MTTEVLTADHHGEAHHHDYSHHDTMDVFGFWIYILSDCVLFATLFAVFIVLKGNTFGGEGMGQLTNVPYVFVETMALLLSSFTYGLAILSLYKSHRPSAIFWLIVTVLLGMTFVGLELNEFIHMYTEGHGFNTSAAMSAFYTLVGTHGLHVTMGLIWMIVMLVQLFVFGIRREVQRRLAYLGLFWAFLDIVWIFVYTVVYLMGVA